MRRSLEAQQTDEARTVQEISRSYLAFQSTLVGVVADWLWEYGPANDLQDADRQAIEAATEMQLANWIALRSEVARLEAAQPPGVWEQVKRKAGQTDVAKCEHEMETFLHDLTKKLMADLAAVADTTVGVKLAELLRDLNGGIGERWSLHAKAALETITAMEASLAEVRQVLESSTPPVEAEMEDGS